MRFNPRLIKRLLIITFVVSAFSVAGGRSQVTQAQGPGTAIPRHVNPADREAYWQLRRGTITAAQYLAARAQARRLPEAQYLPPAHAPTSAVPPQAVPPSGTWTSIGPAPNNNNGFGGGVSAGRINAIAIDPTTSGTNTVIYLGAANGGVWKSYNNGASWGVLTDNQPILATGAIAIDPNNPNIIYAGTGDDNASYEGSGILKSTDIGANWTLLGNPTPFTTVGSKINRIVIDPHNSQHVFAASSVGLYASIDGGTSWAIPTGIPAGVADDLAITATTNPSTLYAVMRGSGTYRSTDGGTTWNILVNAPVSSGRSAIAMAPSNPATIYLDTSNGAAITGLFYTTNGGNNWTPALSLGGLDFSNGQPGYSSVLVVDPLNPAIVYGGGVDLYRTLNAQATTANWQKISDWANDASLHADQHQLVFTPGCAAAPCGAYVANDGGVYYSSDLSAATPAYVNLNNASLAITQFLGGDLVPNFATTPIALGGTQDIGTVRYIGNTVWREVAGGDGSYTAIDWTNTNYMYSQYIYGQLSQSTDGGATFVQQTTGLPATGSDPNASQNFLFYAPLALDRLDRSHLLLGGRAVWESLNMTTNTPTWYQGSQFFPSYVSAVAISPQSSAIVYAGTSTGSIYKTTGAHSGAQATYTQLTTPAASNYISSVVIDPTDATSNTLFVTTGRGAMTPGGIFMSTNGGGSWNNISGTLPNYPINTTSLYYSGTTRVVLVGTDYGVYFTTNDGGTWTGLNTGLPSVAVNQLAIDQQLTTVVAFTYGRSAWKISIQGAAGTDTIGLFSPPASTFYLRNSNSAGNADFIFQFGPAPSSLIPLAGDWTGIGKTTTGFYSPANAFFYLRNSNSAGNADISFQYGPANAGMIPIVGDWTGQGKKTVGLYSPASGYFYLHNSNSAGGTGSDIVFAYGPPNAGLTPIVGDWTNKGYDSVGLYNQANAFFYLHNCNTATCGSSDTIFQYGPATSNGGAPATALIGHWVNGNPATIGVYVPANAYWYLKNTNAAGNADTQFQYGPGPNAGWLAVIGHWGTPGTVDIEPN